jgi:hypothetical protein
MTAGHQNMPPQIHLSWHKTYPRWLFLRNHRYQRCRVEVAFLKVESFTFIKEILFVRVSASLTKKKIAD